MPGTASDIDKLFGSDRKPDADPDSSGSRDDKGSVGDSDIGAPEPIEFEFIEPTTIRIDESGDGPRLTKSGRIDKRTKSGRGTRKEVSENLSGITIKDLLVGISSTLQALTGVEECEIDEGEAARLGKTIERLNEIHGNTVSPKAMAWCDFMAALGAIVGPRYVAYRARKQVERAAKPQMVPPGPKAVPQPAKVNGAPAPGKTSAPNPFPTPGDYWQEPLEGY
jgi:hypothetical protein